jgi:hypothetical protein
MGPAAALGFGNWMDSSIDNSDSSLVARFVQNCFAIEELAIEYHQTCPALAPW